MKRFGIFGFSLSRPVFVSLFSLSFFLNCAVDNTSKKNKTEGSEKKAIVDSSKSDEDSSDESKNNTLGEELKSLKSEGFYIFQQETVDSDPEAIEAELSGVTTEDDDKETEGASLASSFKYRCFVKILDCDRLKSFENDVVFVRNQISNSTSACKTAASTKMKRKCGGTSTAYAGSPIVKSILSSKPSEGSKPSLYIPLACKTKGEKAIERFTSCRGRGQFSTLCSKVHCK